MDEPPIRLRRTTDKSKHFAYGLSNLRALIFTKMVVEGETIFHHLWRSRKQA